MEGPHRCSRRPHGAIQDSDFKFVETDVPAPARAKCSCANLMLSSDPTQRAWIALKPSHGHPVFASWPETGRKLKSAARLACTYLREGFQAVLLGSHVPGQPCISRCRLIFESPWALSTCLRKRPSTVRRQARGHARTACFGSLIPSRRLFAEPSVTARSLT
jgi:hypothetical protein